MPRTARVIAYQLLLAVSTTLIVACGGKGNPPPPPVITSASATQAGTPLLYTIEIMGSGFVQGSTAAITGGTGYTATYKSSTAIEVTNVAVAASTASLSVTVTNPGGAASNTLGIALTPTIVIGSSTATATIGSATPVTFTASVYGTPSTAVTWSVNGVVGGGTDIGTISPQNAAVASYQAPVVGMPTGGTSVSISATIQQQISIPATVNLVNPIPNPQSVVTVGAPSLSGLSVSFPMRLTGTNFVFSGNPLYTSVVSGDSLCTVTGSSFVSTTQLNATVTVPSGSRTCNITVKNQSPDGTKQATSLLTLPATVTVTPTTGQAVVGSGTGPSFTAIITGTTSTVATWSVDNGTSYGSPSVGSSATSSYIPPNLLPPGGTTAMFRATAAGTYNEAPVTLSNPPPPSGCQYSENPVVRTIGQPIGTDILSCSGNGPVRAAVFSATGSIAGVVFDPTTGNISGKPTAVGSAIYTVTPSNQGGNGPVVTLSIIINPLPPSNCTYPNILGAVGVAILTVKPTCTSGGAPTGFVVDPGNALPLGLSVDPSDGSIHGTINAFLPPQMYTVDLSNSGSVNPTLVKVQISAGNLMNLTPGSMHWGVDGHIDKGGAYTDVTDGVQTGLQLEMSHIKNIFGSTPLAPNSIMYRMSDYVTGCDMLKPPANCDPTTAGYVYKQSIDMLEQDGVIVPLIGLITYPEYDAPCGGITPSFATSSEADMYSWAHCTALNALNFVPENMYWYIGNEWYNQGPLANACLSKGDDICGVNPLNWQNAPNYRAYLGAMAGAIAAIRETSPQAKVVSSGTAGSLILGFSIALLQDLQKYKNAVYPNGRDLTWDYTSVHWGADAAQDPATYYDSKNQPVTRYYENDGFPDKAFCSAYCGNRMTYYDAYTTLYQATGKPLFIDEFTSSDAGQQSLGNTAAATTDGFAAHDISALMDNFLAHSLALSGKELGIVGANFYELYQQPCTSQPCSSAPYDVDHFLYSYDPSTMRATLQPQGSAVKSWIAQPQHGNPSVTSGQTPPFTFAASPSQVSVGAGSTTTITIPVSPATGTTGQGVTVALTCTVMVSTAFTLPNVASCQVTNAGSSTSATGAAVLKVTTPSGMPNLDFYYVQVIGSTTTSSGTAIADKIVQVCVNSCPTGVTVGH